VFTIGGDGRVFIVDTKSDIGATPTGGSLSIKADRRGGTASIVFPSLNDFNDDYAFIKYQSNYDATDELAQKGRLTIGVENNASEDEIVITSCGGSGNIKLQGNVEITGTLTNAIIGIRTIRNFLNFQPLQPAGGVGADCLINHAINLRPTYMGTGKYKITFTNGKVPPNTFYSVSITGTWNNRADNNSGMVYSVCKKTTTDFIITQKKPTGGLENGDTGTSDGYQSEPFTEVTVSY
jgi:hypothetical protein